MLMQWVPRWLAERPGSACLAFARLVRLVELWLAVRPKAAGARRPAGARFAGQQLEMSSAAVTQYEVCVLVLGWLQDAKFGRTAAALKRWGRGFSCF